MNLANKITIFRFLMVPVFIFCMYFFPKESVVPFLIFVIASASDSLDGYIARKYNMITNFGKFMDPLADKVLVLSACILISERGEMPGWIVIVIAARELMITGLRVLAADQGITIAASKLGKIKTITQMVTILLYFFYCITNGILFFKIYRVFLYLMTIATVVSGLDYMLKNKDVLRE